MLVAIGLWKLEELVVYVELGRLAGMDHEAADNLLEGSSPEELIHSHMGNAIPWSFATRGHQQVYSCNQIPAHLGSTVHLSSLQAALLCSRRIGLDLGIDTALAVGVVYQSLLK